MREPGSRRLCWMEGSRMVATQWGDRTGFRMRTLVWAAMKGGRSGWWEEWVETKWGNKPVYRGSW